MSMPVSTATCLRIVFAWMMSGLMSLSMTGWIGWINAGISSDFPAHWAHALVPVWPAALTIVLIAVPLVQRLTQRLVAPGPIQPRKGNSPPGGQRVVRLTAGKTDRSGRRTDIPLGPLIWLIQRPTPIAMTLTYVEVARLDIGP